MVDRNKKVFVMMSGGVDSSVAAALLNKRGFDVTGVFMKNWDFSVSPVNKIGGQGVCPWIQDQQDARRVAAKLDIPFYVLNFEKEYKKLVFEPFIEGVRQGLTPNPDIFCNQEIKFGAFLKRALALGADMVATGHYARVARERKAKNKKSKSIYKLLKAKDKKKDQTYFLYRLSQFQLSKTLFPIGDYHKSDVRTMAKEFGLATFNKPDSQGICFVGETPFDEFLRQFIPSQEGIIQNKEEKAVGSHKGVAFYTIGQRRGLGIGGITKPLFVAQKDALKNIITVVPEGDSLLYGKKLVAASCSWIKGVPPSPSPFPCRARFRHQQELQSATVSAEKNATIRATFTKAQRAITPGQSIVLYKGQAILGGGIIKTTIAE